MLYYKCYKVNFKQGGSYIDSPNCIKTAALNHEELINDPHRIKPFINKCNWKRINYPTEKDDWKKFETNNLTISLNVLHA